MANRENATNIQLPKNLDKRELDRFFNRLVEIVDKLDNKRNNIKPLNTDATLEDVINKINEMLL